jgi:hypothetical protein
VAGARSCAGNQRGHHSPTLSPVSTRRPGHRRADASCSSAYCCAARLVAKPDLCARHTRPHRSTYATAATSICCTNSGTCTQRDLREPDRLQHPRGGQAHATSSPTRRPGATAFRTQMMCATGILRLRLWNWRSRSSDKASARRCVGGTVRRSQPRPHAPRVRRGHLAVHDALHGSVRTRVPSQAHPGCA